MGRGTLLVSFSGGRTSAYMAHWLLMNKSNEYNLQFVFMNTGVEHLKTLEFIDQCDKAWGLNLTWLEAVVHLGERKASTHRVVSYGTASRNGEPFEAMCEKYGIPNRSYNHCTRELKLGPFNSWMKENHQGALRAVGIRADEFDRMSVNAQRDKIIYPLISMRPTTKAEVLSWWKKQSFDLEIPEHHGNCVTCWKNQTAN